MSCVWMLQRGHGGDGCVLASTLCKYDLRKGDLFVLSWARVRRVRRGSLFGAADVWWRCAFSCPHDVPAKALRILFLLYTLSATWMLCFLNDSDMSSWTPTIFGHCTRGNCPR